jgi:hypothetical protein
MHVVTDLDFNALFLDVKAGFQKENNYNPVTHNHIEKQIIINNPTYHNYQGKAFATKAIFSAQNCDIKL